MLCLSEACVLVMRCHMLIAFCLNCFAGCFAQRTEAVKQGHPLYLEQKA